jgi:hypothetical protein
VTGGIVFDTSGAQLTNGVFRNQVGTVSAPSYTFINDLSMGLYDPSTNVLGFVTSGLERMRIANNGNVGIGTANPGNQLELSTDSAGKPSPNTWTITSDRRVKTNIEDANVQMCYDNVKQLKLKRFSYDPSYAFIRNIQDRNMVGWIAQDVETVFPKAVTITPVDPITQYSNFYGLDVDQIYKSMYGALHKVISDKEALETEVSALKGRVKALEDRLS